MSAVTALNLNPGITSDTQVGGRGSSEQRGFDTTLTLISRLEATTLSMIDPIQIHARIWEWETDSLRSPKVNVNNGFQYFTQNGGQSPTQRIVRNNYTQVFIGPVETEGTLRREETNTGDEHEYQVEEKEAVALGRDMNQSLLYTAGAKGITSGGSTNRVMGGVASYGQQNLKFGDLTTAAANAYQQYTVAFNQASNGSTVTPALTASGGVGNVANAVNDGSTVWMVQGKSGNVDVTAANVVVPTTTYTFTRKALNKVLADAFDGGGAPTNIVVGPGLRSVLTEVIARGGANNDIYRVNMTDPSEIMNTTSVYITDFGFRLRIDTEQQNKLSYGGDPSMLLAFNPRNIKMGYITPVTRNDDIPQPIYGAASALVAEATAVLYNPADIVMWKGLDYDITSSNYANVA